MGSGREVERVERRGKWWIATIRYEHRFDDVVAGDWEQSQQARQVAQGAAYRTGRIHEEPAVHQVRVPHEPMRGEESVRDLAREVTQVVES